MMRRVLVIEDNEDLAYGLRNNLEIEGYEVEVVTDGATGLERARASEPDLVILDLMLPEMDGYHLLRRLRAAGSDVPVLILTARGEETDKVTGFRLGADDYVTKPFG
ncbi:MAG: response regulator, partial [Gemmatimonadota bacterium]